MATLHIPHTSTALPHTGKKPSTSQRTVGTRPAKRAPQQFTATRASYTPEDDSLLEDDSFRETDPKRTQVWLGAGLFVVSAFSLFLAFIPKYTMAVFLIGGITFLSSLIGVVYARAGKFGFGVASVVCLLAMALASSVTVVLGWFNNVLGFFS